MCDQLTFAGLYECPGSWNSSSSNTQHTRDRDFMRRVLFFIQEHLTENITLASVAASVGYSENYFSALFHRCFHTNFRTYLGRMRVNFAAYLIKQGTPILSAAMDSGFNSLATFYQIYRREYGTTPSKSPKNKATRQLCRKIGDTLFSV
ncbi:MAG: helix-turn-helix domain-containing protein [Christensenellaceae bacterium]